MPATQEDEAGFGAVELAGDVVMVVMAEVLVVMEDVVGDVALEGVVDTVGRSDPYPT